MQLCDQRVALKQYGAGLTVIVLYMVLVQGLCVRWLLNLISIFNDLCIRLLVNEGNRKY